MVEKVSKQKSTEIKCLNLEIFQKLSIQNIKFSKKKLYLNIIVNNGRWDKRTHVDKEGWVQTVPFCADALNG